MNIVLNLDILLQFEIYTECTAIKIFWLLQATRKIEFYFTFKLDLGKHIRIFNPEIFIPVSVVKILFCITLLLK